MSGINMDKVLQELKSSTNAKNEKEILKNLRVIIEHSETTYVKEIVTFKKLLYLDNTKIQIVVVEAIAELCKNKDNRRTFTNANVINRLMHFIESGSSELIFITMRAVANICYENEEACFLVDKVGIGSIMAVLRDDSKRDNDSMTLKALGLLVNLLTTHEKMCKTALKNDIWPVIEKLFLKYKDLPEVSSGIILYLLTIINSLPDHMEDKEFTISENLTIGVIDIFKNSEDPEISVLCLEIIHATLDNEDMKTLLAKEGMCELLFDLIEKYKHTVNDDESRYILRTACDIIVLILTGDSCMELLYTEGEGKTYQNMLTWLTSEDPDLLSTGILAIGNFARKDTHCIQMVRNDMVTRLIDILKKYNTSTDLSDFKVQHALLSTLKNLVIPKENKEQAIKHNIIDIIYPLLEQNRAMIVFKLLGTLRMIVDGQPEAAFNLLSRKDFVERLVYWCYNSDHFGVRGEVPRIFSWLIKNTHSSEPFTMFVSVKDSVKCIVEMMSSNHAVMQNESFFALHILAVSLSNTENTKDELEMFYQSVCDGSIGKTLNFTINKHAEKWDGHITDNVLTLLAQLIKSEKVVEDLKSNNISESLEKLKSLDSNVGKSDSVDNILEALG